MFTIWRRTTRRRSIVIIAILALITCFIVTVLLDYTDKLRKEIFIIGEEEVKDANYKRSYANGRHSEELSDKVLPDENKVQVVSIEDDINKSQIVSVLPLSREIGPGELGKPVVLSNLSEIQNSAVKLGFEKYSLNEYVSDRISLHRSLPDVRLQGCKEEKYSSNLPPTSVIVCFYNEAWSVLLRTVHSIIDRSPPQFIKEIILVDDFSDKPQLGRPLHDYVARLPKVRIIRTSKREGLIRARLMGGSAAKAQILTYLDSHCECTEGWLEPLLQRIANNWTTVVCPIIDEIHHDTFRYYWKDSGFFFLGGFNWNLNFIWDSIPQRVKTRRKLSWDPVWSPTMAGGLFSIDKKYFEKLGTYDSGFDIYGGENLELSFKIWMCGGTLEIVPCSHVGHVLRKSKPYDWTSGLKRNSVRLAEVWLDDYKRFYYETINYDLGNFGNIEHRKELRRQLQCKSFEWYIKNIYPEIYVPGDTIASGEMRNQGFDGKTCLDNLFGKFLGGSPGLFPCHLQGGQQHWIMSKNGEIRHVTNCLDYAGGNVVTLYRCHGLKGNQFWIYNPQTNMLRHNISDKCLELYSIKSNVSLKMSPCTGVIEQRWTFGNYTTSSNIPTSSYLTLSN